jgi:RHS repeat-associated protein
VFAAIRISGSVCPLEERMTVKGSLRFGACVLIAFVAILSRNSGVTHVVAQGTSLVAGVAFSEGTGTTSADASPNNNLTTITGPQWVTGRYGNGLALDGVDDYAEMADASTLDVTSAMTMEAWVSPLAVPTGTSTFTVAAQDSSGNVAAQEFQVTNVGAAKTFTYDANGNLTSDGTTVYEWDVNNRLVKLGSGSSTIDIILDGRGRPFQETHRSAGVVTDVVHFLFCGNELCRTDSTANGVTFLASTFGTVNGTTTHFQTRDHLGSVRDVTAADSSLIDRFDYSPFGELVGGSGDDARYATYRTVGGKQWLTWYRVYDSQLGRWLSTDPFGMVDGPNRYAYVSNNPLKWIDPLGLYGQTATDDRPYNGPNNTTVCDGNGKITVYLTPLTTIQDRCLGGCFLTHEVIHYSDLLAANPLACAGAKAGVRVTFVDPAEVKQTERKACGVTFECLADKKRRCPNCRSTIDDYINSVLRKYCAQF